MSADDGFLVLLVAPTGRDACLIEGALKAAGLVSESLKNVEAAVKEFNAREVGALLIAEEALNPENIACLSQALKKQPVWSSIPVLILTMGGKETAAHRLRERKRLPLANTTQLERPVRVATLVSSVNAALQARSSQYERRQSQEALRQSERLALVGRLASSIAHEINNPLEAVTNLLYLLDSTSLTPEQRGYLDTAQKELARVTEMAAQTLTFNRQRDVKGQASMSALLDSVLVLYQGRMISSKVAVDRHYQNTPPITCYPGELRQVFANLIGNAFDATRKEGGRIVLRERAATHPKTGQQGIRVTIADSGEGMSEEVRGHAFEAFKSTKGLSGSGLGLWISKGIIDKHHGSIRFCSSTKPDKSGTLFSIFLPFEPGEHGKIEESPIAVESPNAAPRQAPSQPFRHSASFPLPPSL